MWKGILKLTLHSLSSGGWISSFVMGAVSLMVAAMVSSIVSPKIAIILGATSLTIVVWVVAVAMIRSVPDGKSEQQTATANPLPVLERSTSEGPRVYLREKSPNDVALRIKALNALERDLVVKQTLIGRWVRWSGEIFRISSSSSFLQGGVATVLVGDHVVGHPNASLEFLSTERHLVEPLQEGDLVSYEARITRAFSTEIFLADVTFKQAEERSIVGITPEQLMRFFDGHTDIQAKTRAEEYVGKWMKVSLQVTFANRSPAHMFFRKKWVDRVSSLTRGDIITVLGQITYVERDNLVLHSCEFMDP